MLRKTGSAQADDEQDLDAQIQEVLDSADRMFIATAVGGNTSGASVFFARDGADLVFFTFHPSRKAEQIRANPTVQAVVWPKDQEGIRGLQVEGECYPVKDAHQLSRAYAAILRVTDAFKTYMDDEFLNKHRVVGYYRLRPTTIKYVDFHAIPQFQWREYPENQVSAGQALLRSVGSSVRIWIRAVRAPFFTATLIPVLLGGVIAYGHLRAASLSASWEGSRFAWALLGALLAQAATNLANDYGDHRSRNDELNRVPSPFNGGSRVIQAGLLAPWKVLCAAFLCFAATIGIGVALNAMLNGSPLAPTPLLVVGLIGCTLGAAYTLGPFRLAYRGWGEPAIGLGFGPIMVLGAHYVMTAGHIDGWLWHAPLLASLPVAVFVAAIVWINEFPDVPADGEVGKDTWVVRTAREQNGALRYERPFYVYMSLLGIGFLLILLLGVLGFYRPALSSSFVLLGLLPAPLALVVIRWGYAWLAKWNAPGGDRQRLPYEMLKINAATIGLHFVTGVLLIIAYALAALGTL